MKDQLIDSPLVGTKDSCYVLPINETHKAYKDLATGFETNDFMVEGEFNFDKLEETMPELYKDIKIVDQDKKVWYPQTINVEGKGVAFILGTNKEDWTWAGIKSVEVSEDEKEKFKHPTTGEYLKYKSDQTTLKRFPRDEFVETLDYIGML